MRDKAAFFIDSRNLKSQKISMKSMNISVPAKRGFIFCSSKAGRPQGDVPLKAPIFGGKDILCNSDTTAQK